MDAPSTAGMGSSTGWLAVATVGIGAVLVTVTRDDPVQVETFAWWALYGVYAVAFWLSDHLGPGRGRAALTLGALVGAGTGMLLLEPAMGWTSILLVVTVVVAAFDFDRAVVVTLVMGQTVVAAVAAVLADQSSSSVVVTTLAYGTFQAFAAVVVTIARREADARHELALAHAELRATTTLLETSSRNAERLRISRELHDTLGHRLTALALALEVASHQVDGPASVQVGNARSMVKELLTDVRRTVGALREPPPALTPALEELVATLPGLDVQLSVEETVPVAPERSLAVIRCVQELATNALRHGEATRLEVTVVNDDEGLRVSAADDGRGTRTVQLGNGLTGMRERFDELGGSVEFVSGPGAGFRLDARVPA
jgi:signal transduction histidine kinase